MPPKKSQKDPSTPSSEDQQKKTQFNSESNRDENETSHTGEKRKGAPSEGTESKEPPAKASKQSASNEALIKFLLSPKALELCHNEKTNPASADGEIEKDYFTTDLTPFEHLLCAVILSRPISHTLGQRTIKTVLNPPWSFSNPQNILDAGKENEDGKTQRVEAMEAARTQHRQKTAQELANLAEAVVREKWDPDGDGGLSGLLKVAENREGIRKVLNKEIKGVGNTAVDIFLRRVQSCSGWEMVRWFIDGKTKDSLEELGLPGEAEALQTLLKDSVEDPQGSFVVVMERALGIVLEGKQAEVEKVT